jgi:hypothetical protein
MGKFRGPRCTSMGANARESRGYDWRDHNRTLRDGILGRCPRVGFPVVSTLEVWVTEMDLTFPTDEQGDLK